MPTLKTKSEEGGQRLDVLLAKAFPQYSRSFLQRVVRSGGVKTAARVLSEPNYRVQPGQIFEIIEFANAGEDTEVTTARIAPVLKNVQAPSILFEDDALLVIDKPAGLVVHPAAGHKHGTLIDWLREHLGSVVAKNFTDPERLGLVHRLDKGTSGVLLIAKSVTSQTAISRQFQGRTVQKEYVAFVEGMPSSSSGVISAPVARSRKNPMRMAVSNHGRPSETSFLVEEQFPSTLYGGTASRTTVKEVTQMRLRPKTGRTHQIRVHLAAIGHPIVGDFTYGSQAAWKERLDINRPLLHAEKISVLHPISKKAMSFNAPWPKDFLRVQKKFREGFKVAAAVVAVLIAGVTNGKCDDDTPAAPVKKTAHHASSSSAGVVSAANFKALRKQVAASQQTLESLQQAVAALQQQTAKLQSSIENLNSEQRFRDLDHAITELNAKSVSAGTNVDEMKTTVLEVVRHMKDQQSTLDQIRDQLDRLQREAIHQRTKAEETGEAPTLPAGASPTPSKDAQ